VRNRVSQCLRVLLNGAEDVQEMKDIESNKLRILTDVGQSRAVCIRILLSGAFGKRRY
jgi:hypothetical protein